MLRVIVTVSSIHNSNSYNVVAVPILMEINMNTNMNNDILLCINSVDSGVLQWRLLHANAMLPETVQCLYDMNGLYIGVNDELYSQESVQLASYVCGYCYDNSFKDDIKDSGLVQQLDDDIAGKVFEVPLRVVEIGY